MDYKPFDYGKEINKWRVPTEEMPDKYMNPQFRMAQYDKIIKELVDRVAKDITWDLEIRQEEIPKRQIFEYMLKLVPAQDLFEFYEHKPETETQIYLMAAKTYDPECFDPAVELLKQQSVPDVSLDQIVQMLADS